MASDLYILDIYIFFHCGEKRPRLFSKCHYLLKIKKEKKCIKRKDKNEINR